MRLIRMVFLGLLLSTLSINVKAQNVAYFGFEPDITTNYVLDEGSDRRSLGYIRVTVELMLNSTADLAVVEYHQALLRDAIIRVLSSETEGRIRSLTGREEIREACLDEVQALIEREMGRQIIKDLIFTKYIYQ